jgi:translation initiation factor IF-1
MPPNRPPSRNNNSQNRSGQGHNRPPQRQQPHHEEEEADKEKAIELEGVVTAVLAGTMFRVKLRNGHQVLAHISGKMRKRFIRLVIGDGVKLEMSPYDPDKARIVYRL